MIAERFEVSKVFHAFSPKAAISDNVLRTYKVVPEGNDLGGALCPLLGDDGQHIFKSATCFVIMPVSSVIVFINFSYNKIYFF